MKFLNLGFDTDLLKLLSALVVAVFLALTYMKKVYLPVLTSFKRRMEVRKKNKAVLAARKGGTK